MDRSGSEWTEVEEGDEVSLNENKFQEGICLCGVCAWLCACTVRACVHIGMHVYLYVNNCIDLLVAKFACCLYG